MNLIPPIEDPTRLRTRAISRELEKWNEIERFGHAYQSLQLLTEHPFIYLRNLEETIREEQGSKDKELGVSWDTYVLVYGWGK